MLTSTLEDIPGTALVSNHPGLIEPYFFNDLRTIWAGVTGLTHGCVGHRRYAASYHRLNFMSMRLCSNLVPGALARVFQPSRATLQAFLVVAAGGCDHQKGGGPKAASWWGQCVWRYWAAYLLRRLPLAPPAAADQAHSEGFVAGGMGTPLDGQPPGQRPRGRYRRGLQKIPTGRTRRRLGTIAIGHGVLLRAG